MDEVTKTKYRCPFHPEVRSDESKKCYKCGMKLEPYTPSPGTSSTSKNTSK